MDLLSLPPCLETWQLGWSVGHRIRLVHAFGLSTRLESQINEHGKIEEEKPSVKFSFPYNLMYIMIFLQLSSQLYMLSSINLIYVIRLKRQILLSENSPYQY